MFVIAKDILGVENNVVLKLLAKLYQIKYHKN